MTIDWVTEKPAVCERSHEWALATCFGRVDGVDRFRISFVDGSGWLAADLLAPEGDPSATFAGSHMECVEWCWGRSA